MFNSFSTYLASLKHHILSLFLGQIYGITYQALIEKPMVEGFGEEQ
jgi:hypothetical protein